MLMTIVALLGGGIMALDKMRIDIFPSTHGRGCVVGDFHHRDIDSALRCR